MKTIAFLILINLFLISKNSMSEIIDINNFQGERFFDTNGNEWIQIPKGSNARIVCNFNYLDDEEIFQKKILAIEGDPVAAFYVANEYLGKNQNAGEAYLWLLIAAQNGSKKAIELLNDGKNNLFSHIDKNIDKRSIFKVNH